MYLPAHSLVAVPWSHYDSFLRIFFVEFLVIGMGGSHYSQSPVLVKFWNQEGRIVAQSGSRLPVGPPVELWACSLVQSARPSLRMPAFRLDNVDT